EELAELVPVEDWLCASSSALMVSGEICGQPLPPEPPLVFELVEADVPAEKSNRPVVSWLAPVGWVDDDFDDVSALRASRADDAAPRANNMAVLQQCRGTGGVHLTPVPQQAPCHGENLNKTVGFCIARGTGQSAIDAAAADFSARGTAAPCPHCPRPSRMLG